MSAYRTWQVSSGETVTGPFPERLICEHVLLGRIGQDHLLSMDGHSWRPYVECPEIVQGIEQMLGNTGTKAKDPKWQEERLHALLRHFDERKRPDRRGYETQLQATQFAAMRSGQERRSVPETVQQHAYREITAEVDHALAPEKVKTGRMAVVLVVLTILVAVAMQRYQSEIPVNIGLYITKGACGTAPVKGVDWRRCSKAGYLLVGADLRHANLTGADLRGANLAQANLSGALLDGAKLDGAVLDGATWVDGRLCREASVGQCIQ